MESEIDLFTSVMKIKLVKNLIDINDTIILDCAESDNSKSDTDLELTR